MLATYVDTLLSDLAAPEGKTFRYSHQEANEKLKWWSQVIGHEADFGDDIQAWRAWFLENDEHYREWTEAEHARRRNSFNLVRWRSR